MNLSASQIEKLKRFWEARNREGSNDDNENVNWTTTIDKISNRCALLVLLMTVVFAVFVTTAYLLHGHNSSFISQLFDGEFVLCTWTKTFQAVLSVWFAANNGAVNRNGGIPLDDLKSCKRLRLSIILYILMEVVIHFCFSELDNWDTLVFVFFLAALPIINHVIYEWEQLINEIVNLPD